MNISIRRAALIAATSFALLATPAFAEMVDYNATLSGVEEVPPNDATGTGTLAASYDTETKVLSWTIEYDGLTGPATAAHYHGPADAGAKAGPVVPIEGDLATPIVGEATLTDAQAEELKAGKWYFNLHTANYPDGELRGQVALTNPDN